MEKTEKKTPMWVLQLNGDLKDFSETNGFDEDITEKLRAFMFTKCKDHYIRGNKSGIRWACSPEGKQKLGLMA